ncbi:MAG: radical SAM protein [Aigarchaeota archaeon]|nr:radical SAM protein [Aigarchaeota archaeon]MCX8192850.1 radical SAM protein [Nitrososphaeria archaeon]MDW7986578.1 radical SAM protein [Nitrososphaerota archaeon]
MTSEPIDVVEGYDPLKLTEIIREKVTRRVDNVEERRYYRFRKDRWYGGIATGDVVGCNLRCGMCWSWRSASHMMAEGSYFTPSSVYKRLKNIAHSSGLTMVRLSGGEPTISKDHLLDLLDHFENSGLEFILETNGLVIGDDLDYAEKLVKYKCLVVRVSLKGCSRSDFYKITLAKPEYFDLQLKALENLIEVGAKPCEKVYAAVMLSFSELKEYEKLKERLSNIDPLLSKCIDEEYVILYPHVVELLEKRRLKPTVAFKPESIPKSLI